jgi:hypothetical protein
MHYALMGYGEVEYYLTDSIPQHWKEIITLATLTLGKESPVPFLAGKDMDVTLLTKLHWLCTHLYDHSY